MDNKSCSIKVIFYILIVDLENDKLDKILYKQKFVNVRKLYSLQVLLNF